YYPFFLNKGSREIYLYEELLDLTKAEYEILSFMLENKNQALTRESIALNSASISPDSSNKSIDVIIGRLRAKIEKERKYIYSVRGIGYKLQLKDQ
ncbi:MAG: winged helix-turn-helix domain-containing protein, partial [Helicobacter sp.]|nr:winged helix-turn-helix domain-containing protein [Helicobacter sp.]